MIKLLKYDWKRNATTTLAGLLILLVAQLIITTIGWRNGWNPQAVIVIAFMLFLFSGFLIFLVACQTFHANMKAYSRRLLPLPTIYTIVSPLVLMFGLTFALFLLCAAYDAVFSLLYDKISLLQAVTEILTVGEAATIIGMGLWGSLFTTLIIFFSIAFSRIVEGRGGTFLGIAVCIAIFSLIPWIEDLFVMRSGADSLSYGMIHLIKSDSGDGTASLTFGSFNSLEWVALAFEIGVAISLIYGTIYLIERRIKL
ncbi:hypothetical protein [Paenibacillus paeoniae]|uniref:ABC transporter permease n=1 Tax=Paenibacillus paeoniae TaxID=2292705 RepID=A0A371PJ01_9BACL|nr:hypothetical protein [Paenibacillus paeoniae]REK76123.1 hypothetical protein DX130_03400 [Paenibacillus paeoniae]